MGIGAFNKDVLMAVTQQTRLATSEEFLHTLEPFERVLVVTHDNPDPDAIAAGWGILALVEERLEKPVALVAGGAIVRAENRHMVELLSPPLRMVSEIKTTSECALVLVDCGLGTSNHLLTRQGLRPVAILDHHEVHQRPAEVTFIDQRPDVAATASIVADYLQQQAVEPGEKLATAMLYAIRTETRGYETHHTDLDRQVVLWLTERADPTLLAEIECAPLSRNYFSDLALALQSTLVFDDAALCLLPRAEGAEIVGELADLLVRCRSLKRVLSGAIVQGDLLVSVRTECEDDSAAELVAAVVEGLGNGGGHSHRAGGKIANIANCGLSIPQLKAELRRRWLEACHLPADLCSMPLISRYEIIRHL